MKLRIDAVTNKVTTATTVELHLDPRTMRAIYLALTLLIHLCIA
ncbi:hypothetical protein ACTXMW_16070 [Brachybacterium paraconglomeratum]|nr:hypothetical protein [Brachybacterium sp. HMSC06H03]